MDGLETGATSAAPISSSDMRTGPRSTERLFSQPRERPALLLVQLRTDRGLVIRGCCE